MALSERLILMVVALGGVYCQRSPYASGGHSLDVLPQYTQATPLQNSDTLNRLGDSGDVVTTPRGPSLAGSLHDQDAINKVSSWPKDKQPFWYLNNDQLAGHRGLASTSTTSQPAQSQDLNQRFGGFATGSRGQPATGSRGDQSRYPSRSGPSNPTPFPRLFRPA